jgi:hypothetical protein
LLGVTGREADPDARIRPPEGDQVAGSQWLAMVWLACTDSVPHHQIPA